jgi:hypothetical protein
MTQAGGSMSVYFFSSLLDLFSLPVEADAARASDPEWIQLIDSRRFLQERFQQVIPLPMDIARGQAIAALELATNIRQGIIEHGAVGFSVSMVPKLSGDAAVWRESLRLGIVREEAVVLFGMRLLLARSFARPRV